MKNIRLKSRCIKNKRLFAISYFNESLAQYTADLEENPFEDTNDDMYSKSMLNYHDNFILPKPLPNSKSIVSKARIYIKIRGVIQSRISENIIVGLFHRSHINKSLGLCRQGVDNDEFFKINQ